MSGCGAWPLFVAVVSSLVGTLVLVLVPGACLWFGPTWRNLRFSMSRGPFSLFGHSVLIPCDDTLQKLKKNP